MEEEAEKDEHVVLPALPAAHKSVIEKARKQVEGKPILAQYAGGKPWTAKSFKPVPSLASPPPPPPAGHLPTTTPAPPKHAKPPLRRQQLAPNSPSPVATITTHGVSGSLVAHVLEGSKGKKLHHHHQRQQQQQQQPDSTGAAADEALKNVLLASITAQAQHCAGGGADGGEGGGEKAGPAGVTRRQVARLVLDANNLTESSMKMKQICGRATRLLADVERLHSGGAVLADVTERYRSITQRQDEASIWRDDSGSGSDTPGSDGGGRPPGARARKQHGGGDGKPDAESAAGGASDSEEEEFEAEPPELEYEDVTGMPAGRITHRAMDTISNIATDLTAIGDASASLQIELGISKKKPAFIKAGVRARDCRRLTMKVIWLQQKVARALDTARSYMIVATKTMNEQARAAHREIKAQRVSIAALQEAVALRDQQINDLETEVTTRDAAGIASDGALSGDLQTCRFASPPADDAHAFDRLLNGSRALLARLQRKLMAAGEDAVRHYGGALAATAHPQAFALQPGGSREGPGNRGVTTLKGKRQTEARREKELDSLRRFSAFLDRLVDVRGLLSGRYVPADVLDSAARHITVAQLGLSGQAPVAPAMHATMSAESIEDAAKQLRYAALFTHHLASTFAEAVRMLFTPKNTRASVANEKEASGGGAQGKPTPPSASLAAVDLFNLPPVTANTAQDVTERISKAETVFLAGFSAKGGAAACAGIVEPRQAGAGPGPGGEWCALPTVLPHRKGYLSTLQLMSRNAAMKPARDTLLEQVGGWTIARLLQKDAADTPVSVQVIVHVAVCLVTGRVPKVENLSHLAALPIPTIEEDLANPQTPGTDHGGDAAPGARTANPPSANLEGASAASMKRPSRALSSHNNSGNANNNPAAAKKEKLRAKSRKGRGASHAKLSNAIALEAEETDLSAMVRMDSTGSDDAHDDKPAPARRLSGLAINVRALSMVSSTGTQSAPATPGPLSPSRWSVPWGETQLQLGDLAERLVPLAAALDPLDLGPAQQAAVLGVSAYLVSHGPTVPRYAEPVRGWILALAACLERKDEAAYHCEYWPRDAPQSLQESSMAAVPPDKVVEAPVSTICGSTVGHLAATFMFLVRQERSAAARQQRCTCQGAPGARRQNHPGVADKNPASKSEK